MPTTCVGVGVLEGLVTVGGVGPRSAAPVLCGGETPCDGVGVRAEGEAAGAPVFDGLAPVVTGAVGPDDVTGLVVAAGVAALADSVRLAGWADVGGVAAMTRKKVAVLGGSVARPPGALGPPDAAAVTVAIGVGGAACVATTVPTCRAGGWGEGGAFGIVVSGVSAGLFGKETCTTRSRIACGVGVGSPSTAVSCARK